MASYWLKPRQVVVLDAQSCGPARNFYVRPLSIVLILLLLTLLPFAAGSWYAPFHSAQEIIPQNLMLKRKTEELKNELADANTLNDLKDEQLDSLEDEINLQEDNVRNLSKQLRMFKSILETRKGTGVQLLQSQARWTSDKQIRWQSVLVKGGSLPRFLSGRYNLFGKDDKGHRFSLLGEKQKYRFETHTFLQRTFAWQQAWQPSRLELIVYNAAGKVVLTKNTPISGE